MKFELPPSAFQFLMKEQTFYETIFFFQFRSLTFLKLPIAFLHKTEA